MKIACVKVYLVAENRQNRGAIKFSSCRLSVDDSIWLTSGIFFVPAPSSIHYAYNRQHERNLYEHADDGGERGTRL